LALSLLPPETIVTARNITELRTTTGLHDGGDNFAVRLALTGFHDAANGQLRIGRYFG